MAETVQALVRLAQLHAVDSVRVVTMDVERRVVLVHVVPNVRLPARVHLHLDPAVLHVVLGAQKHAPLHVDPDVNLHVTRNVPADAVETALEAVVDARIYVRPDVHQRVLIVQEDVREIVAEVA